MKDVTNTFLVQSLFIDGPLPGLNDLLTAKSRGHGKYNAYNRIKQNWTAKIRKAAAEAKLIPVVAAKFQFLWIEPSRRRDPDNIAAGGRKLILDALVDEGVIPNDGWDQVAGWNDTFVVDKSSPGVSVIIMEATGAFER